MVSDVINSGTPPGLRNSQPATKRDCDRSPVIMIKTNCIKKAGPPFARGQVAFALPPQTTPIPRNFFTFATIRDAFPAGQGYGGTSQEQGT